jgi:hypothetical protein
MFERMLLWRVARYLNSNEQPKEIRKGGAFVHHEFIVVLIGALMFHRRIDDDFVVTDDDVCILNMNIIYRSVYCYERYDSPPPISGVFVCRYHVSM